jgi:tetratricopeptide (TPR) repeat protein
MSENGARYRIGNTGKEAVVQQGEYLFNTSVQVQTTEDANDLLHRLRKELGERSYHGPSLRRLDPIVLINRAEQIVEVSRFLEQSNDSILYVVGIAGVGKSTLVRGALEFRHANTPAVWLTCEGLDADQLLTELNAGLHLEVGVLLDDTITSLTKKISVVLGAMKQPCIFILDGFEVLLDAKDHYRSTAIARVIEAFVTLEHKAKVLITTRRLPYGVGKGSMGTKILRIRGLKDKMAEALFQTRANIPAEEFQSMLPIEAFAKLEGHPKFIEMLASAIDDLPIDQIVTGLLNATDIGDFVVNEVLSQMDAAELQILRTALVFRRNFSFEALDSVHKAISDGTPITAARVRKLVHRALLEIVDEPGIAYYLHSILRDAVPRETTQEADAHTAAADWFQRKPFDAKNLTTWDDGLYHLRRAAEVGREPEYVEPYKDFLLENNQVLQYAGWGQRLVDEYEILIDLVKDKTVKIVILLNVANNLDLLGELEEATELYTVISEVLAKNHHQAKGEKDDAFIAIIAMVKTKLAQLLVMQTKFDEALQLADEVEPEVNISDDLNLKYLYALLRFSIVRKSTRDPQEMLNWALKTFGSAEKLLEVSPSPWVKDKLAEAHFALACSYLRLGEMAKVIDHCSAQLRIKLEIGKLSGVAAGLYNMSVIFSASNRDQPAFAGVLLLTSKQIRLEIGRIKIDHDEHDETIIQECLNKVSNIDQGRKFLSRISDQLLPYFERALEHRLDTGGD